MSKTAIRELSVLALRECAKKCFGLAGIAREWGVCAPPPFEGATFTPGVAGEGGAMGVLV